MSLRYNKNTSTAPISLTYRNVLWIALLLNAAMFLIEIVGGVKASSTSLLADALDFLGDGVNYGTSIMVLNWTLAKRAKAAIFNGLSMAAFGLFVLGKSLYGLFYHVMPNPMTMGIISILALSVNVLVALLLYRYRSGDSNMRSIWIGSRIDALGNIAVMAAASGVSATHTVYPDLLAAILIATLAIWGAAQVFVHARQDMRQSVTEPA